MEKKQVQDGGWSSLDDISDCVESKKDNVQRRLFLKGFQMDGMFLLEGVVVALSSTQQDIQMSMAINKKNS